MRHKCLHGSVINVGSFRAPVQVHSTRMLFPFLILTFACVAVCLQVYGCSCLQIIATVHIHSEYINMCYLSWPPCSLTWVYFCLPSSVCHILLQQSKDMSIAPDIFFFFFSSGWRQPLRSVPSPWQHVFSICLFVCQSASGISPKTVF